MADNSTLPATGDVIRDIDKSGKKTQVIVIDAGGAGAENLLTLAIPNVFTDMSAVAIGSIATIWTPGGATKIRLQGGCFSLSATASVLFEDNSAGTTVFRTPIIPAGQPYNFDLGNGKLLSTNSHVLKATASATASITGTLYGTEE